MSVKDPFHPFLGSVVVVSTPPAGPPNPFLGSVVDAGPVFPRLGAGPWLAWVPSGDKLSGFYSATANALYVDVDGSTATFPVASIHDAGSGSYLAGDAYAGPRTNGYLRCRAKFNGGVPGSQGGFTGNTTYRAWLGLSEDPTGYAGTDTPGLAVDGAAFRFSTAAGDTHYKACVSKGNVGAFALVDTGIAPDDSYHDFEIYFDAVNVNYAIDGVIVAQIARTNLSSNFIDYWNPFVAIKDLSGSGAYMLFAYMYVDTSNK